MDNIIKRIPARDKVRACPELYFDGTGTVGVTNGVCYVLDYFSDRIEKLGITCIRVLLGESGKVIIECDKEIFDLKCEKWSEPFCNVALLSAYPNPDDDVNVNNIAYTQLCSKRMTVRVNGNEGYTNLFFENGECVDEPTLFVHKDHESQGTAWTMLEFVYDERLFGEIIPHSDAVREHIVKTAEKHRECVFIFNDHAKHDDSYIESFNT
ncbi:MAG: hypothetical protein IKV53_07650 [Clostridia bacterium]|nr:hypothetical protein [Clostridia bacterium]